VIALWEVVGGCVLSPLPRKPAARANPWLTAKVAEYQRRGLVHFHAVLRLDGADGPGDPTPPALTPDALRDAVTTAARAAVLTVARPDGTPMVLAWGGQLDLRTITPADTARLEDGDGQITDASLAGYIAKYSTKGTSATDGVDRPTREIEHLEHRDLSPHHARMIRTLWDLGGLAQYEELGLRRWALPHQEPALLDDVSGPAG
jgi:hypothetical protein